MHSRDIVDVLDHLIVTCRDGELGFRGCERHAASDALRALFEERAQACASAAAELRGLLVALGGADVEAGDAGSAGGAVHRGWLALKGTLAGPDDLAVLEQCESGEETALERYREALEEELPAPLRACIEQQYQGLLRNHAAVRAWRDRLRDERA